MKARRQFVAAVVALASSALPIAAFGQAPGRVPRIGFITLRSRGHELEAAFVQGMRELGYLEGKTIAIEWRFAGGKAERLPALAAELVAARVELIVAASTQAIQAVAAATKSIPIVFPANADPVGSGFAKSLSRPGGNVTGLSTIAADLGAKQIELMQAVVPKLQKIAVLTNPSNIGSALVIRDFEESAGKAGLTVQTFEAQTAEGIDKAFAAMAATHVGAVTLAIDGLFVQESGRIVKLALQHKLPFVSTQALDAEAGGLISYGAGLRQNYRRVATYVDRILKGAKPAEMPVEQPTVVELVINLKTAKALGITVPNSLVVRADRVIE